MRQLSLLLLSSLAAAAAHALQPALPGTTRLQLFRYTDPVTHQEVTRPNPPPDYFWKRTGIDEEGTWILEVGGKKPPDPPPEPPEPLKRSGTMERPLSPVAVDLPDGMGEKLADICFEAHRKNFYDPYSARMDEFKTVRMPDGGIAVVVMLNGKNRFGGYVGSQPFYCRKKADGEWTGGKGEP